MKIWELVKTIEEAKESDSIELSEAKAIMMVNFGPNGQCNSGLVNKQKNLPVMICDVFTHYEDIKKILLTACKMAYGKHHLGDDSIGWEELGTKLHDTLCSVMGDSGYQDWIENYKNYNED